MAVSAKRIEAFRTAYKKAYDEEVTVAEAREMASQLLALYRFLMQPLPSQGAAVLHNRDLTYAGTMRVHAHASWAEIVFPWRSRPHGATPTSQELAKHSARRLPRSQFGCRASQ